MRADQHTHAPVRSWPPLSREDEQALDRLEHCARMISSGAFPRAVEPQAPPAVPPATRSWPAVGLGLVLILALAASLLLLSA